MNAIPVVLAALVLAHGQGPISDERTAVEQAESILVRYDLSAVVPSVDAEGYRESLLRSAGNLNLRYDRANLQDMYTSAGMDVVVDLIQNVLGAEFEYEGRRIDMSGENELLVLAPQEIQRKVRRILAALEGALSGAVHIRIDVVTMPTEGAGALPEESVVDAARVDGLLEAMGRASSRETYELRLSPGRTSVLDLMREIPVLLDYDVEIAQGAAIHDPIVGYAEEGTRLLVRGSPAKGGVGLTVVYTRGDALQDGPSSHKVEIRSLLNSESEGNIHYADGPTLFEVVDVLCRSVAFSTFLPDGKALLVSSRADLRGEKTRQVIAIRKTGGSLEPYKKHAVEGTQRQLLMVNAEYFEAPSTSIEGPRKPVEMGSWRKAVELSSEVHGEQALFLFDWIDAHFSVWRTFGPWVVCVYDPSWDADAAARLEELLGQWSSPMRITDVSVTLRAGGRGVPVSWRLPLREGSEAAALLAIVGNQLIDYDVEVAQFAAAVDPVLTPTFDGLAVRVRTGPTSVAVRALAALATGPPRTVDIGSPMMSSLERSITDNLFVDERLAIQPGEAQVFVLGNSSDHGEGPSLSLEIRVN